MIKAIVYESNAGHTKRYAELLSGETGVPACELKDSGNKLSKGDEVIFMGWLMAGNVKGYKKAAGRYSVKAVCTVGMASPSAKFAEETINRYNIRDARVFYLQGGFNLSKLHGIYRFMMNMMAKGVTASLEKKQDKTPEDNASLEMFKNGGDYVRSENLADIVNWYNSLRSWSEITDMLAEMLYGKRSAIFMHSRYDGEYSNVAPDGSGKNRNFKVFRNK